MGSWMAWGGSAAVLGLLAGGWKYIRMAWSQLSSRAIVHVSLQGAAATAVRAYVLREFRQSQFGPRTYIGHWAFVRPRHRYESIAGEHLGSGSLIFWQGWKPLWMERGSATGNQDDGTLIIHRPVNLTFFRGLFSADDLVQTALDYFNELNQDKAAGRYRVHHWTGTAGKQAQINQGGGPR